jgi:hypothetical protein
MGRRLGAKPGLRKTVMFHVKHSGKDTLLRAMFHVKHLPADCRLDPGFGDFLAGK